VHAGDGRVIITPSGARLLPCPTPLVIVATPRFTG
jgi:hypothetical protein